MLTETSRTTAVLFPVDDHDVRAEYSQEEWDEAPRLFVYGRRERNADNSVRIALDVVPPRSDAPIGNDEVAF